MNPKNQGPTNIRRTIEKKTENPTHDTEKDENRTRTHWRKATRGYLVYHLAKHEWKWPKTPEGKNAKLLRKGLAQIMIELSGI